ncbi:MAG TPA: peptide chain release factor N(5)-glutamine methyltransferase [Longimicrobiales bacterium]
MRPLAQREMTETTLPLAQKAAQLFAERGFDNARLEAELLLAHVLRVKRLDLYLQFERPLTNQELETFRALVRRRLKHEPLQYIMGSAAFRQLELQVDRRVLIPRPETEVLAGCAIAWSLARGGVARALDIGTGSGAIALSLVHEQAAANVVATDLSSDAIAVARANAQRAGLIERIEFRCGAGWEPVGTDERFDIVISNPPYIAEAERDTLQPEVRDWEPATALFAGDDGLAVVREIARGAPRHLSAGGLLALEVGMTQASAVADELRGQAAFQDVKVVRDLAGRDRVVTAVRKAEA